MLFEMEKDDRVKRKEDLVSKTHDGLIWVFLFVDRQYCYYYTRDPNMLFYKVVVHDVHLLLIINILIKNNKKKEMYLK